MKSSDATERRALARQVCSLAPALLFGSVALELAHPDLLSHVPRDIDFLIPLASIEPITEGIDHIWTSWDEPIDAETLPGRFYVRGRHHTRPTIDLTYESPLHWDQAWARRVMCEGIAIISGRDLATIYKTRGRAGDAELATKLER